jgi:quercetin dioxygenase-like cupin family protein
MKKREIKYYHSMASEIEMVYCKNSHISYPEHNHISVYTIVLVIDGCIELEKKDGTAIYSADELFVIPPYEPHSIISGKEGYTTLTVCMKKELFSESGMIIVGIPCT